MDRDLQLMDSAEGVQNSISSTSLLKDSNLQNSNQKDNMRKLNKASKKIHKKPKISGVPAISEYEIRIPKHTKSKPLNLASRIKKVSIWKQDSHFKGAKQTADFQICHYSYKLMHFPDERKFLTSNKLKLNLSEYDKREFMHLYRLVYCVGCSIPVYWMCLGEDVPVQEVQIKKKKYLVFECDCCKFSTSFDQEVKTCVECQNQGGYMQKLNGLTDKFIHPVCALSFPNVYQIGNPSDMRFGLCDDLVEPPKDASTHSCDICKKSTSRSIKCKDYEKYKKQAHAFCIFNQNKELIFQNDVKQRFDYEDQMAQKWSIQLFFKDTFDSVKDSFEKLPPGGEYKQQSPFMRVFCNEQRSQTTLCHCDGHSDQKSNVTQCSSCFMWFHQDQECWGEHVDLAQGGPSDQYVKDHQNEIPEAEEMEDVEMDSDDDENEEEEGEEEREENDQDEEMNSETNQEEEGIANIGKQIQEDFILCEKCLKVSQLSNKYFAEIILNQKTIEDLLPFINDNWSTATKLIDMVPAFDFRTMGTWEFSIFEHIMLYRFWFKIVEQSASRKLHEELYQEILEKSQVHIFNTQSINNKVLQKLHEKQQIQHEMKNVKFQSFFFKEVFGLKDSDKLLQENIDYNLAEKGRIEQFIEDNLSHQNIITSETQEYYDKLQEAESFHQIAEIYRQEHIESYKVRQLLITLRQSPSFDHTQSQSFRKLDHDFSIYLSWEHKNTQMVKDSKCKFTSDAILKKIRNFKGRDRTADGLSQLQYEFMKSLFSNKITTKQAELAIQSGENLFIQNTEELNSLKQAILLARKLSDQVEYIKNYQKPVKTLAQHIANIALSCVKPSNINEILMKYKKIQEYRIKVKSLLCDKIEFNKIWLFEIFKKGKNPEEVTNQYKQRGIQLRKKFPHMVFSLEEVQQLYDNNCVLDAEIREKLNHKYLKIQGLLTKSFENMKKEDATIEEILQFIKKIDSIENVDLDYHRDLANKKLSLLRIGQKYLDGNDNKHGKGSLSKKQILQPSSSDQQQLFSDIKILKGIINEAETEGSHDYSLIDIQRQSTADVDHQDDLMKAIKILEQRQQDKIIFPEELCMMLNAKIQVAHNLKKEFQNIIDSQPDSFSAQMVKEMKKCVQQAYKEHGLHMTKERAIIENMKYSEVWYDQAYQKLKATLGQSALNNVDIMQFMDILGCIQNQQQLDQLLEICKMTNQASVPVIQKVNSSSSNQKVINIQGNFLVCAAKNLHQSLLRCQWMVQVQQMLGTGKFHKQEGIETNKVAKDIQQVLKLCCEINELQLQDLIQNPPKKDEETFRQMRDLESFTSEYNRLMSTGKVLSDAIHKYEKTDDPLQSLDRLLAEIEQLDKQRQQLNIVNSAVTEKGKISNVFSQAKLQIKFSKRYNEIKIQNAPTKKLTIDQSYELLEQAQKIVTEDSHIIKKLQKNIGRFDQFKRNYNEYIRFKKRQKEEIQQNQNSGFARDRSDLRFTYEFVEEMIQDIESLDIDIFSERKDQSQAKFNIDGLKNDLKQYDEFKEKFLKLLQEIETEIFEKQSYQAIEDLNARGLIGQFQQMRIDITLLPVFDKQTFKKIKAFVWIFNAYELVQTGQIDKDSPFHYQIETRGDDNSKQYMSIKQWKEFIKYHESFLKIMPDLKDHSIVQQLLWQVQVAQDVIDEVKNQRQIVSQFNGLFNKGTDHWRLANMASRDQAIDFETELEYTKGGQFDTENKKGFFKGKLGDKLQDLKSHMNQKQGIIGPNIQKDMLMGQFKKKLNVEEFLEKRRQAEHEIKINLSEELRFINKWISDFEELEKYKHATSLDQETQSGSKIQPKFPYQKLFELHQFDHLKLLAKQVFISPVYNWPLFSALKKRLENAYEIRQDLKYMAREQEQLMRKSSNIGYSFAKQIKKLQISRVQPYIAQYWQNCRVKGLPEIDQMINSVDKSRSLIKQINEKLKFQSHNDEPLSDQIKLVNEIKSLYSQLEFDFESEDIKIKTEIWLKEVNLFKASIEKKKQLKEEEYAKLYKIDVDEFKIFDSDFEKLKIKKNHKEVAEWYIEFRKDITNFLKEISKAQSLEIIEEIKKTSKEDGALSLVDFSQLIEDKCAKFRRGLTGSEIQQNSPQSSKNSGSSSSGSGSSSSSSSSSGSSSGDDESGEDSRSNNSNSSSVQSSNLSDDEEEAENENSCSSIQNSSSQSGLTRTRAKRQIKAPKDEYSIYYDQKRQKVEKANQKVNVKEKEKEEKRKELKRIQKQFEKQKEKEKLKRMENMKEKKEVGTIGINNNQFNQVGMYNDKEFTDLRNWGIQKIRNESRRKILNLINQVKETYKLNDEKNSQQFCDQIEHKAFEMSLNKVDEVYSKKVDDILKNLKFILTEHEDFCEAMFVKGQCNILKLMQSHPRFRDYSQDIQNKLSDRKRKLLKRKQLEDEQKNRSSQQKKEESKKEVDPAVKALFIQNAINQKNPEVPSVVVQESEEQKDQEFSDDDNFSQDSNPAVFSSDEDQPNQFYDDSGIHKSRPNPYAGSTAYSNPLLIQDQLAQQKKAPVVKYNPVSVIQQYRQPNDEFIKSAYYGLQSSKSLNGVQLDDIQEIGPTRESVQQKLNQANPGSLLRVWSGKLDLLAHFSKSHLKKYSQYIDIDVYSKQDIRMLQELPNWPDQNNSLPLRGQIELQEVIKHFTRLQNDNKKIIKGWITIRGLKNQINLDRYSNHYEELRIQNKGSLFVLYDSYKNINGLRPADIKEVHLYLVPITEQTVQFCAQMGIQPEEQHFQEFPNLFAFFVNIKHLDYSQVEKMNISKNKLPTLNPEVVNHIEHMRDVLPPLGMAMPHHTEIKLEQIDSQFDEEEAKIDALIHQIKVTNMGYDEIMIALNPYLEMNRQNAISKRSEQKLMKCISELIEQQKENQRQQQEMMMQPEQIEMQHQIKLEDAPPGIHQQAFYPPQAPNPYMQPHIPMMVPPPVENLTPDQIERMIILNQEGRLTPEQQFFLQQQIARMNQQFY